MPNLKTVAKPDLPDDPRDCCRAMMDILKPLDDLPLRDGPGDAIWLVSVLMENDDMGAVEEVRAPIQRLTSQAMGWADAHALALSRVWDLARHGTTDHREIDECDAERQKAQAEGREVPPMPAEFYEQLVQAEEDHERQEQLAELGREVATLTPEQAEDVRRKIAEIKAG